METCCGYGYGLARKSVKGLEPQRDRTGDLVFGDQMGVGADADVHPSPRNPFYQSTSESLLPRRRQLPCVSTRSAATLGFRPRLHFQGPTTAHGTPQEPRRSTLPRPYRLASSFQGHGVLNRKENSSPDRRQCMQGHSLYKDRYTLARALGDVLSGTRFWNKYQIPFRLRIYNG